MPSFAQSANIKIASVKMMLTSYSKFPAPGPTGPWCLDRGGHPGSGVSVGAFPVTHNSRGSEKGHKHINGYGDRPVSHLFFQV